MSWLTILNDNGQSFPDAELMALAANSMSKRFPALADPPTAEPLRLVCYPFGSTAAGSPYAPPPPPPAPPPPPPMYIDEDSLSEVVVTGTRLRRDALQSASPVMVAGEENLGDLKLYRVPEPVTVAAKGQKQVAFLDKQGVTGRFVYVQDCDPYEERDEDLAPARILFATENTERRGLGAALPNGGLTLYEPTSTGDQLVA